MREDTGAPALLASLVAGAGIGLLGVALFGLAHALAIVPIWTRLAGGIPFGVAAGVAMGWALFELRAAGRFDRGARAGMLFGILLWSTLLPMTALTVWLREAGLHSNQNNWELAFELLLVALTAVLGGWLLTHRRRAILALAVASLALALAQAGPIPVTNSVRAAGLFGGLSVVYPACGLALVHAAALVHKYGWPGRSTRPSSPKRVS